jgi:hypothetical protein
MQVKKELFKEVEIYTNDAEVSQPVGRVTVEFKGNKLRYCSTSPIFGSDVWVDFIKMSESRLGKYYAAEFSGGWTCFTIEK